MRMQRRLRVALLLLTVVLAGCGPDDSGHPPPPKQVIDLSPAITEDSACRYLGRRTCDFLGVPPRTPFSPFVPTNPNLAYGMVGFMLPSHGGAHVDAPARLLREGLRADQIPLDRLMGPARLWDIRWHDRNTPLQITDLGNQSPVQPGEILLLLTGYTPPPANEWPLYTWLSPQAASWLAARSIRALATDMPSIGSFEQYARMLEDGRPPEDVWAERLPFFEAGIPVIEGLTNLDQLVGKSTIVFIGLPLAVQDRSGAPMRAAALIY
jgi:arylformamidase